MKHTFEEACSCLDSEREYQDRRWPGHKHFVGAYLTYMWHYYREAEKLDSTTDGSECQALVSLRKLGALGVVCMEQNGLISRDGEFRAFPPVPRDVIYWNLKYERDYQDSLGPDRVEKPKKEEPFEIGEELTLIRRYLRKADDAWSDVAGDKQALHEIRKITAIVIRCLQNHGCPMRD